MGILEKINRKSRGVEKRFKYKAVLFVPSESYDAAAITIIQGLEELGFTIYTMRPNINSWWCNKVIDNPANHKYDFVLWNMHWGTRWGFYDKYKLHKHFNVLIDGCDNRAKHTWQDKYDFYCHKYKGKIRPQEALRFRGNGKIGRERQIDFTNIPGPGDARRRLRDFIARGKLPGRVHNSKVTGGPVIPKEIEHLVRRDNNIHSYFRWVLHRAYFKVLNDTKVFIYSNVYDRAHWDSKKIWEAYASGCLCLLEKPRVDMSQYPVTELCEAAQFKDYDELVQKAKWLYHNQGRLEQLRLRAVEGALKYFNATQIARYFLWWILSEQKGQQ